MSKSPLASKTIWFNALAVALMVAHSFGFGEFEPSAEATEIATAIIAAANIVLRFVTTQPIRGSNG